MTPVEQEIALALFGARLTVAQLAVATGRARNTIWVALGRMEERGDVVRRHGPRTGKSGNTPFEFSLRGAQ